MKVIISSFTFGFITCFVCLSIWAGIFLNYMDEPEPEDQNITSLEVARI
jgi:hypothetical protein